MNSRKVLFAMLGGVALTTAIGILLSPYKDSFRGKKIVEKAGDYTDTAGETIKDSVANIKNQLKSVKTPTE